MCQKTHHSFAMDAVDEAALTVVPHAPAGRTLHVSFLPMGLAANDGVQTEMMHINSTTPLDVWTQRVREFIRFPATRPLRYRVGDVVYYPEDVFGPQGPNRVSVDWLPDAVGAGAVVVAHSAAEKTKVGRNQSSNPAQSTAGTNSVLFTTRQSSLMRKAAKPLLQTAPSRACALPLLFQITSCADRTQSRTPRSSASWRGTSRRRRRGTR